MEKAERESRLFSATGAVPGRKKHILIQVEDETVWLNRNQIATLFDRDVKTIGKHINNALMEELAGYPVVAKFATTAADGKTYQTDHYNIEMVFTINLLTGLIPQERPGFSLDNVFLPGDICRLSY